MVTPGSEKVFAGEGISLIGLKEGGELLVNEIAAAGEPVEIIAGGGISQLVGNRSVTAGDAAYRGIPPEPDR
jgi:hypothetical protein